MPNCDLLYMVRGCHLRPLASMRSSALKKGEEALDFARSTGEVGCYDAMCLLLNLKNGGKCMSELQALVPELETYIQPCKKNAA
jgi:hypothetical protein